MGEQAAEGDITPMSDVIGRDYPERGQLGGLEWSRPRNWIAAAQQQRRLRRSSAPSLLKGYRSLAGWGPATSYCGRTCDGRRSLARIAERDPDDVPHRKGRHWREKAVDLVGGHEPIIVGHHGIPS
jgi:hypothetical protein